MEIEIAMMRQRSWRAIAGFQLLLITSLLSYATAVAQPTTNGQQPDVQKAAELQQLDAELADIEQQLSDVSEILLQPDKQTEGQVRNLSDLDRKLPNYEPLLTRVHEILRAQEKLIGRNDPRTAEAQRLRGCLYFLMGQNVPAVARLEHAAKISEATDPWHCAMSLMTLRELHLAARHPQEAEATVARIESAIAAFEKLPAASASRIATLRHFQQHGGLLTNRVGFNQRTGQPGLTVRAAREAVIWSGDQQIGRLPANTTVPLFARNASWLKVPLPAGGFGWVQQSDVTVSVAAQQTRDSAVAKHRPDGSSTMPRVGNSVPLTSIPLPELTAAERQKMDSAAVELEKVLQLEKDGRYRDAIELQSHVLQSLEQFLGKDHILIASQLNVLARIQLAAGNATEAERLMRRSLPMIENHFGPDHAHTAVALNGLANTLIELSMFPEADKLFERALGIVAKTDGVESSQYAQALENRANVLHHLADYEAAEKAFLQALKTRRADPQTQPAELARTLSATASLYQNMANFDTAARFAQEALELNRKSLRGKHPAIAATLMTLGSFEQSRGNFRGAEDNIREALAIRTESLGKDHPATIGTVNNLALLKQETGDLPAAEKLIRQAMEQTNRVVGPDTLLAAVIQNNLGSILSDAGRLTEARNCYEQSLSIRETHLKPEHPDVVSSIENLAIVYYALGKSQEARNLLQKAVDSRRTSLGNRHPTTAIALHNWGMVLADAGDSAEAEPLLLEALEIRRDVFGVNHAETANSLRALAQVRSDTGQIQDAIRLYEEALKVSTDVQGEEHPAAGRIHHNLGLLFQRTGKLQEAREHYQRSMDIKRKSIGEYHPDLDVTLYNIMLLELMEGNEAAAVELADIARRNSRQFLSRILPSLSPSEQLQFLAKDFRTSFFGTQSIGVRFPSDSEAANRSAEWLINGKGITQDTLTAAQRMAASMRGLKNDSGFEELTRVRNQLANLAMSASGDHDAERRRKQLQELSAQEGRLIRNLGTAANMDSSEWIDLDRVRSALPDNSVLIDLCRLPVFEVTREDSHWLPARYAAWITRPNADAPVQIVSLGDAEQIDALVKRARQQIQAATDERNTAMHELATTVWNPIRQVLPDVNELIISPDGALWLMPWDALPVADDRFLIEDYSIRFVVSGRDLLRKQAADADYGPPVILADPAFDQKSDEKRKSIKLLFPASP
ncbi:MAG: tetratricopeptide repeat protein [Planctomycetaceae bacterium]